MPLSRHEKLLLEAVQTALSSPDALGLKSHLKAINDANSAELGFEHLHAQIDDMFALRAVELDHYTGVCAAFDKVHKHKYIDSPGFAQSLDGELRSQGVPREERDKAAEYVDLVVAELGREKLREAPDGGGVDMGDMRAASQVRD